MYEYESAAVRLGIDFLTALNEKDYLLDPSFDPVDLELKLNEIQADVNFLISNLPVEAIDDDVEREEECPGDFEDSEELEDEVVECEKLISQATALLAAVREHYLPDYPIQQAPSLPSEPASPAGHVSVVPTPKAADRMAARKAERRKEARKSWLQVLLVLAGIALALLLIAINSD